ncbi:MAG: response regulator [Filimonas sp.]|nr:response regulator [Filimonas sp.]
MQISLNRRLYIGFTLAIILVIFVCAASYLTFQKQSDESGWVTHTYQVLDKTTEVRETITDMRGSRRSYRLTGDTKYLAPYTQSLAQIAPQINELKQMVRDNSVQYERIDSLKDATQRLIAYWEEMPLIHPSDDHAKTVEITRQEETLMDYTKDLLLHITQEENKLLVMREESNSKLLGMVGNILLFGGLLILVVVFILIYTIANEFRIRKKAEGELKDNYEELEQLNTEATEKNWLLEGNATINDSLQGAVNSATLSQDVLTALVKYLGVPAGALYLLDENDNKLHQVATVAVIANTQQVFAIGEGIVGNAALTKEISLIRNVPDEYWKVQSGTGNTSGKGEIACMPFWLNKELKGVIELGNFSPFTEGQINLLRTIVRNIATAMDARQASEKVDALFGQVQEQKEILEHQQEELRQTNEELTRQAEILQASEEELKVQEEELRQINAELEEKNEAVEVARQTLSIKAKELEVTSKYKSEFLANMSHELRTPLNSVLILAKLLAENKPGNLTDKQVEYANIVHKSGTDLLKLINDILDLSKIEAGKIELHFEKVTTEFILKDIQQLFAVVADDKQVTFTLNKEADVPEHIYTDKQRLEQVIKNLLSNAFKFTPKQGSVTLNMRIEKDRSSISDITLLQAEHVVAIDVKDTGIGIGTDKQQLIFEAFQQADGSTSRKYGGTGLGLSISKELIKILGGEIRVTSIEGQGSTFTLYIPAGKRNVSVYKEDSNAVVENDEQKEIKPLKEIDFSQLVQQTAVKDDRADIQPSDRVMLVIEDDPSFAAILRDFARNKRYKAIIALHGDEGLYYAQKYKPDAITLDIQIPVIDGWTVLKALKNDPSLKNIPVHVISAMDDTQTRLSGAIAYLKKPVEKEDLEKAFSIIGSHVAEHAKKVIVLSGEIVKDGSLQNLLEQRNFEVECTYARSVSEVIERMKEIRYDCIIADIGADIEKGVADLQALNVASNLQDIPVIIYLDKDITAADELRLNKISPVIIRESTHAKDRLLDEMELFLYKVQEVEDKPGGMQRKVSAIPLSNDILANKKILLVDDDMRNVFALSTALEEQHMNVVPAGDGKEALDILRSDSNIDLVLMDVMMPEMDGYEATKRIRNELKLTKLPIIALTAKAMTGDREKCIAAGASDYISKPVDTGKLFSLMRVWLSQ